MLALIFLLIFGSAVAYLALQNTSHVTVTVLNYSFYDIPLFSVIIGSVLVGALIVYIIHLINSISTSFTIHGKNKKIHHLELENEALKKGDPSAITDNKSL